MLESLRAAFGEDLPLDDLLRRRLTWAKFIGLLFFYNKAGDCWNGENNDVKEGLLASYSLFPGLFQQPEDLVNIPSALPMLVELSAQVMIQL